jgi:hypothetical protein
MPWYVFALVDRTPLGGKGKGLSGPLGLRRIPGGFAVVERRADVPPAEFGSLKRHHDVVADLAPRVDAILPVRFGTLLDADAIEEALADRDEEIADAFDVVRGRVQFTWRKAGTLEPGRQKTEDRRRKTEDGRRKTEEGRRKPEAGRGKPEAGRRQDQAPNTCGGPPARPSRRRRWRGARCV